MMIQTLHFLSRERRIIKYKKVNKAKISNIRNFNKKKLVSTILAGQI